METMATTDGLTGLTNHREFKQQFADLLERASRHGGKVALLLCDIDFFKKVNDGYGHPVGDEVLRRVARVLQEVPRKIDILARYGGEEFAVLLDNVDASARGRRAHSHRDQQGRRRYREGPAVGHRVDRRGGISEDGGDCATLIELGRLGASTTLGTPVETGW